MGKKFKILTSYLRSTLILLCLPLDIDEVDIALMEALINEIPFTESMILERHTGTRNVTMQMMIAKW